MAINKANSPLGAFSTCRPSIIDMWGMTKDYTCRTGWKLGREPTSLSQSTQCQMASSNSTHSRDTALPVLLRAGGKKSHKDHLVWLLVQHNPWSLIQQLLCWTGGKGISCISKMNFEPALYIGTDSSFRKASHPNWNKDKWPAGVGCHHSAMYSSWGTICKSWWFDCFFLQLSHAQISPFLNVPATFSLENLASNIRVKSLLVPFL